MRIILCLLWITFLLFYVGTRAYQKGKFQECNKKEHPLRGLYPSVYFIYQKLRFETVAKREQRAMSAWRFFAKKGEEKTEYELYVLKKLSMAYAILFLMLSLSVMLELSNAANQQEGGIQQLNDVASDGMETTLEARIIGAEGERKERIQLAMPTYSPEESDQMEEDNQEEDRTQYQNAIQYMDETILQKNFSLDYIGSDLCLMNEIPETQLTVRWEVKPEGVIGLDGSIQNKEIKEAVEVCLVGTIYNEEENYIGTYLRTGHVVSIDEYEYQSWKRELLQYLEDTKDSRVQGKVMDLPQEFQGKQIVWETPKNQNSVFLFLFGVIASVLLYIGMDQDLSKKVITRRKQMQYDYPDIVNKLTLLIGAGMTVSGAWQRIVLDYTKLTQGKEKRYAYEEMLMANQEMQLGVPEAVAIEEFGRHAGVVEYLKLSSILIQNMKKGAEGLTEVLDFMASEAFEVRKQSVKQMGEEAGTKLLLPMMIMLMLVIVIIMVPAFWSLQI